MYCVSVEWINDIYKYLWVISIIIRYWGFVHHFTHLTYYFFINLLCFFSLPFHSVTHFQQLPYMLFSFWPAPPTLPSNEAGRKWQTLLWYYPFFHLCYASLGIKRKCLSIAGMGNPVSNNSHQCLNFYVFIIHLLGKNSLGEWENNFDWTLEEKFWDVAHISMLSLLVVISRQLGNRVDSSDSKTEWF